MAPSPELGQPKAPDKVESSTTSVRPNTAAPSAAATTAATLTATATSMSATAAAAGGIGEGVGGGRPDATTTLTPMQTGDNAGAAPAGVAPTTRDQPKPAAVLPSSSSSTVATQQDSENLSSWDEGDLRKLLDEAITYKCPKDRENKSEIFKELLQNVELEDQARDYFSNRVFSRHTRGSNRHHQQTGSLQDLVESVQSEHMLDGDFVIGGQTRRHHHNSRHKKYSSVSSRESESGSLPSNVNVSCNLCPYEEPFLNEFNRRKSKNDKSIAHGTGAGAIIGHQRVDSADRSGAYDTQGISDGKISHTVIEIGDVEADETRHLLAHDSLAQGIPDPLSGDEGTELNPMKKLPRVAMNYTTHQILNVDVSVGEASRSAHSIDKTVPFGSMLKSTSKPLDMNAVQLNNSYVAVNSCMDSKGGPALTLSGNQNGKFSAYSHGIPKHIDENGNSVPSFNSSLPSTSQPNKVKVKNKINKADRNTKTLIAKEIKGNRGNDNIDALLAFIENKETTKRNGVINVNKNVLNADKNKKKNASKKEAGGNSKLKKSNSLEELKSSSKLEEEIAQSESVQVTMRHKSQTKKNASESKENTNTSSCSSSSSTSTSIGTSIGSNGNANKQSKRGERRSWGTEELSYLGETNCIAKEEDLNKIDKENRKSIRETKQNKKKEEHSLSIVSIESISTSSETAEFHVVTKKKKAKKRQILEEARQKQMHQGRGSDQSSQIHNNRGKYQPSHSYTNDRDVYLTSFNSNDNRRKSTSSVPPSEKSDSSDLDSVHSLPVESSTRLTNIQPTSTSSGSTPQASYADIARITNPDKFLSALPMDKWPIVSGKNLDSPDTSNMSTSSSTSTRSQGSVRPAIKFLADLNECQNSPVLPVHDTSSCSSTSSNSTIVKQVTYSQSLLEEKSTNATLIVDEAKRTIGVTVNSTKSIEISPKGHSTGTSTGGGASAGVVDINKNPLQKSKSVDNDNYVNVNNNEQYPALQKTVKPQKQYQSLPVVELTAKSASTSKLIKMSPMQSNAYTKSSVDNSMLSINSNNSQISGNISAANAPSMTAGNVTGVAGGGSTVSGCSSSNKKTKSVNSYSLPKDIIAARFMQEVHLTSGSDSSTSIDKSIPIDQTNKSSLNINTKSFVSMPSNDGTQASSAIVSTKKSMKKDKTTHHHHHHHHANSSNNNRPAVIILNDNNNHTDSVSPLLFGDFNEEDLRLLETECDQHFTSNHHRHRSSDSHAKNNISIESADSAIVSIGVPITPVASMANQTITTNPSNIGFGSLPNDTITSPQSDLGYSSSHNRSGMSTESLDMISLNQQQQQQQQQQQRQNQQQKQPQQHLSSKTTSTSTCFVPIDNIGHVASNQSKILLNSEPNQTQQNSEPNNNTIQNNNNSNNNNNNNNNNSNSGSGSCTSSGINNNGSGSGSGSVSGGGNNGSGNINSSSNNVNLNNKTNINSNSSGGGNVNSLTWNSNHSTIIINSTATTASVIITASATATATVTAASASAISTTATTVTSSTATSTSSATKTEESFNQSAVTSPNWEKIQTCEKELNVRYIAPAVTPNINSYNHDKIVNFVGSAWENIICGMNGGAQFYNGQ